MIVTGTTSRQELWKISVIIMFSKQHFTIVIVVLVIIIIIIIIHRSGLL
jgi:hypothetical protein